MCSGNVCYLAWLLAFHWVDPIVCSSRKRNRPQSVILSKRTVSGLQRQLATKLSGVLGVYPVGQNANAAQARAPQQYLKPPNKEHNIGQEKPDHDRLSLLLIAA